MRYTIYCDSEVEAYWFKSLCPHKLRNAEVRKIARRGDNPKLIDQLVSYDRPDIILFDGKGPILVVEKTREVPTGHNVGQRFARLAKAAEMGVPSIYFLPYMAKKHGDFENICQMNPRVLLALIRMSKFHKTTCCSFKWPASEDGELIDDGSEDSELQATVSEFLANGGGRMTQLMLKQLDKMQGEYDQRVEDRQSYATPPSSIELIETSKTSLRDSSKKALAICPVSKNRKGTLVYSIEMKPDKCKRQDPYTGMQFIYDYAYCRNGANRSNRTHNLVFKFPLLDSRTFLTKNPNDPGSKSCNWYLLADGFEFSDIYVSNNE